MSAAGLIRAAPAQASRRHLLDAGAWAALPMALAAEPGLEFLGLWGEPGLVHAAFREGGTVLLASLAVPEGRYPALSPARPGAAWFERTVEDLWGLAAEGGDPRPWLDHGRWAVRAPLSAHPGHLAGEPPQPEFRPVEGEGLYQYPIGPILPRGGPGHWRAHLQGETVRALEARLGYGHQGLHSLMLGRTPQAATRLVARISAEATVAHAWAFSAAAEAAMGIEAPPRAALLRLVMAEVERLACHLSDWGEAMGLIGLGWAQARCALLREGLLRAQEAAFGRRLLLDMILPGGVAADIAPGGEAALLDALAALERELPTLQAVQDEHAGVQDRLRGLGVTPPALVEALAPGGPAGRAAGRGFDARHDMPYAPYPGFSFSVPLSAAGDAESRLRLRLRELPESLGLIRAALARLEPGSIAVPLPVGTGEGLAVVESAHGEVLHWLALDQAGLIRACFPRDPAWMQAPLLEAAMIGEALGDLSLCRASINPSLRGIDL
ncbi:hydrogenase large subunit [Roseomonas marmotae]|uniref:Hydrogenase expression protein HypE n=1 Tax=Roseomonas marmotae TaxID=2768161 RepID=A0ABS3KAB7_9PROT|nr:nickel-dependent hydrogenase large subunit [Roseomonas marmotae]MBO1073593.1 hydrogenase expression protein HypE [Roseomonas marmotae]QTI80226.1 hydrogenase expression protein HypE [Roseomonas marmotae]